MSYNYNKLSPTLPEGAKALDLVLTGQWWEAWQKDKSEDYRELTPFWFKRLTGCFPNKREGINKSNSYDWFLKKKEKIQPILNYNHKGFTHIRLSKGYQKDRLSGYVEFEGIEIREGKPEWGAKAGRLYFCIKMKQNQITVK
jgi:hypothetical protein